MARCRAVRHVIVCCSAGCELHNDVLWYGMLYRGFVCFGREQCCMM